MWPTPFYLRAFYAQSAKTSSRCILAFAGYASQHTFNQGCQKGHGPGCGWRGHEAGAHTPAPPPGVGGTNTRRAICIHLLDFHSLPWANMGIVAISAPVSVSDILNCHWRIIQQTLFKMYKLGSTGRKSWAIHHWLCLRQNLVSGRKIHTTTFYTITAVTSILSVTIIVIFSLVTKDCIVTAGKT